MEGTPTTSHHNTRARRAWRHGMNVLESFLGFAEHHHLNHIEGHLDHKDGPGHVDRLGNIIPGPAMDGQHYIAGDITADGIATLHRVNDRRGRHDELSLTFFGLDVNHRTGLTWEGESACHDRPPKRHSQTELSYQQIMLLNETLLSRDKLNRNRFYCRVHSHDAASTEVVSRLPAYLIPRKIGDSNARVVHTYVCNVTSVITKSELLAQQLTNGAVRVSLEMHDVTAAAAESSLTTTTTTTTTAATAAADRSQSISTITDVDLPTSGGVGYSAVMMNSGTQSVLTLRASLVLCALGGYGGTFDSDVDAVHRELKYFIDNGQV
eukprot:19721-Heterococcus_DN1.PRE.1